MKGLPVTGPPGPHAGLRQAGVGPRLSELSNRERELIIFVGRGHTDALIAGQPYISVRSAPIWTGSAATPLAGDVQT
jgi:hypothetical protein